MKGTTNMHTRELPTKQQKYNPFIGQIISRYVIKPDPYKLHALTKIPTPQNKDRLVIITGDTEHQQQHKCVSHCTSWNQWKQIRLETSCTWTYMLLGILTKNLGRKMTIFDPLLVIDKFVYMWWQVW